MQKLNNKNNFSSQANQSKETKSNKMLDDVRKKICKIGKKRTIKILKKLDNKQNDSTKTKELEDKRKKY